MKKIGLLHAALLMAVAAVAQQTDFTLRGHVKSDQGPDLPNAVFALYKVTDSSFVRGTVATADGSFEMRHVQPGNYLAKLTFTGFQPFWTSLGVTGDADLPAYTLKPDGKQLQSVTVSGRRPVIEQHLDATTLTINDLVRKEAANSYEIMRFAPNLYISDNEDNITMAGKDMLQVMINGRVQRMTGRDLVKLLKSIPSSQVESVDLMSNPSSKYDVQGNTGIINIRLKRTDQVGVVDNINLSHSQATHSLGDLSNSLNYANGRFYLTTYLAYHYGHYVTRYNEDALITTAGSPYNLQINNTHLDQWSDPVIKLGLDYSLTSHSTIGAQAEHERSTNTASYYTLTAVGQPGHNPDSSIATNSREPNTRTWNTYNLNYRYHSDHGSELTFDADRSYYKKDDNNTLTNTILKGGGSYPGSINDYNINTQVDLLTFKTDYTKNFRSQVKLEAGAKMSIVRTRNDQLTSDMESGNFKLDSLLSNNYDYHEHIESAYLNFGKSFKKWGFQGGLRYEITQSKGVSTSLYGTSTEKPDTAYGNLLPSVFINYNPTSKSSFRLSFVQRIKRPSYEDLNPFSYQVDEFTYYYGNPGLRVQKNSNLELDYNFRNKLNLAATYVYTTDYFATIFYQQGGIFYQSIENTGYSANLNLNVSYPIQFAKWWSAENKVNGFYSHFRGPLLAGYLNEGMWSYNLYTSQRFVLPGENILRVTARYTAPQLRLYNHDASSGSVSVSVGRQIIRKQGLIRIGVSDIFDTQRQLTTVHFGSLNYVQDNTWESRTVFAEFSLKLGGSKLKQHSDHQTGNAEERSRTK
jgi:hypothetical protein